MLMLMRHAKAAEATGAPNRPQPDIERPLAPRGRRDAPAMARHLAAKGYKPQRVLCSPARRTRETLELLGHDWSLPEARIVDGLYGADADAIWRIVADAGTTDTLVIGHNPGLGDLARRLVRSEEDEARLRSFPTCAFVGIDVYGGRLEVFVTPDML